MNKPDISIILPAIRQDNWDKLYDSILLACKKYTFELILCGPLPLTEKLQLLENVKYVKDLGCPTRASNIAGLLAEGKLITWIADDGVMLEDSLDLNIELLYSMGDFYKNVVIVKYFEGPDGTKKDEQLDSYFYVWNTVIRSPYVPPRWVTFNNPIMYRKFYDEMGGLDVSYESCPMAHIDFGIRCQVAGAKTTISPTPFLDVGHMPEETGDHKAIHRSQKNFDEPLIIKKYHNPNWPVDNPLVLSIDTWKLVPSKWLRRFINGVPKDYQSILKDNEAA